MQLLSYEQSVRVYARILLQHGLFGHAELCGDSGEGVAISHHVDRLFSRCWYRWRASRCDHDDKGGHRRRGGLR